MEKIEVGEIKKFKIIKIDRNLTKTQEKKDD
jgi:hypothetical protein